MEEIKPRTAQGLTPNEPTRVDKDFYENYARKFYHYRYEFYSRSKNPGRLDGDSPADRKLKIFHAIAYGPLLADLEHNEKRPIEIQEFCFVADYSLPVTQIREQLKSFAEKVLNTHKTNKITPIGFGEYILLDHLRDGKGCIEYFGTKEQPFSIWDRLMKAFDLCKKHGEKWTLIGKELGYYDKCHTNNADRIAARQAERDVKKARTLVEKSGFTSLSFFKTIHPPEPLIFQEHSPIPFSRAFTHLG